MLLFETLLSYVANLVIGGSLIRTLADVALRFDPKFDQIDVRRIRRLLMIKSMLIISFLASGLAIFFRSRVYALWRITFGGDVSGDDQLIDDRARQEAKLMACLFTFHAIAYTIQLMWPCFFWYSMSLVARKIRSIRHVIERAGERKFDVAELEPLKGRLLSLNAAFDRINRIFAIPLSIILSLSVLTLIGVACFLVLNGGRQYFVPLLFSYGLFAISRLLLIGYAANLPQNECRELTRVTLECVREWTPNGMLTYLEIRRLSGRFVVRIGHFAIVRQSTIVSLFAFALSYIVILLQTENYQDTSVTAFAGSDDQRNNQTFENVTSNIIESVL